MAWHIWLIYTRAPSDGNILVTMIDAEQYRMSSNKGVRLITAWQNIDGLKYRHKKLFRTK